MPVLHCSLFLGDEVCLILCDPTAADVVDLLDSLAAIAAKDAPANLSALALSCLKPNTDPPSSTYVVQCGNKKAASIPVPVKRGNEKDNKNSITTGMQQEEETPESNQYKNDSFITLKHDLEKSAFIEPESKNIGTSSTQQDEDHSVAVLKNQQQKNSSVASFGADKSDSILQQEDKSGSNSETKKSPTSQLKEDENSISTGTGIQQRKKQTASDAILDAGLVPVVKDDPVEEAISSLWCNKDELVTSDDFRMAEFFKKSKTKIKLKRMGVSNKSIKVGSPLGGKRSKGPAAFSSGSSTGSSKTSRRDRSWPLVTPSYIFNHISEEDEVASIKVEISPSDIILPTSSKDDGFNDGANPASNMDGQCGTGIGKSRAETVKDEDADESGEEGLEASDSNPEVQVKSVTYNRFRRFSRSTGCFQT
jgi:hypothetical protein